MKCLNLLSLLPYCPGYTPRPLIWSTILTRTFHKQNYITIIFLSQHSVCINNIEANSKKIVDIISLVKQYIRTLMS